MQQSLYNGIRFPVEGPDLDNIEKIDLGAFPMIHRMMRHGLRVDLDHFKKMEKILSDHMDRLTEEVYTSTGHRINIDSGDQLSDLLFKKLGIKQARPRMTTSGDRESTDNETLVAIQHEHEIVPLVLEYKTCSKLYGTYVLPMPKLAKRSKLGVWRMYPNLGCMTVPSGRLNCYEPNLLAMPNRTDLGRTVCEGFIAEDGYVYLSIDQSQIEPRVVTHRSKDENLISVYTNEEDIYSDFAIAAFHLADKRFRDDEGWHYPGVDKKKHRFPAKTCILASIYEVSASGLLEQLPTICSNCYLDATKHTCGKFSSLWTEDKAQELITAFYMKYPGVMAMRKADHARARKHAYVWDEFGRILHVQAIRSVLKWVVSGALREAGNFPIQSTAQGTIKLTMAQVEDDFVDMGVYGDIADPLLQIHDELLFEVREEWADEIGAHVANRFENCIKLDIPVKAGIAKAVNWGLLPK